MRINFSTIDGQRVCIPTIDLVMFRRLDGPVLNKFQYFFALNNYRWQVIEQTFFDVFKAINKEEFIP